ncbi:MAG: hypothetical protein L3K11_03280 [Thermoplasmata archaeon]|nr:hypothetical protein [Thermoplasmata archaeon]
MLWVGLLGSLLLPLLLFGGGGFHPSERLAPVAGEGDRVPALGFASVEIVPAAATLAAGQNGSFALWVGSSVPGCAVETPVVVWELSVLAQPIGTLLSPTGASVVFSAFPGVSGTVELSATVEGSVVCPANNVSFGTEAQASIATIPALFLSDWSAGNTPAVPGAAVRCSGNLSGGEPPYQLGFDFGDGNRTPLTLPRAGGFSVVHRYGLGTYLPSVSVSDPLGERVTAQVNSAVLVASALAAELVPQSAGPELGAPFAVGALVEGGFPPYTYLWNDSAGDAGTGPSWTVPAPTARELGLQLEVSDRLGGLVVVDREFPVAAAVQVTLGVVGAAGGDVDRPLPFHLALAGGVGPFAVTGSSVPSGSTFTFTSAGPGNWTEAVVPSIAAPLWLSLTVTDALGVGVSETLPLARVHSAPFLLANLTPSVSEVGGSVEVVGLTGGGTPPLNWSIGTTARISTAAARSGSLSSGGVFAWNGTLASAGAALFVVTLVDGAGDSVSSNLTLRVLAPLEASAILASTSPTSGTPLTLSFTIAGGVLPYRYSLRLSDGTGTAGNASLPGPGDWTAPPAPSGFLLVQFDVTDALGFRNESSLTLTIAPGGGVGSGPPRAGDANATPAASAGGTGLAWVLLPAGLVLGTLWLFRSRLPSRAKPTVPEPRGALPTLRRLVRDAEGLDEDTLLLLAEEEGIDPETTRQALRRWIALGRIESVTEPEEPTTYHWRERGEIGARPRPERGEAEP